MALFNFLVKCSISVEIDVMGISEFPRSIGKNCTCIFTISQDSLESLVYCKNIWTVLYFNMYIYVFQDGALMSATTHDYQFPFQIFN